MKHILLVLVAVSIGCAAADGEPATNAADGPPTAEPRGREALVDADPGYVGVIMPSAAIDVAPTYDGKLQAVHATVGQWVDKGAAVATFDPAEAREALAIARAEVRVAKGRAAEAAAVARHARSRLKTERSLFSQGITAADNVSDARADRARAGAATSSAAGQIAGAKARVEQLERQLHEMHLAAPFSGRVAIVYREGGAVAGPAKPVLRLIDTQRSFVRFAVPPAEAALLTAGQQVEIAVDWLESPMRATVRDFAPEIDAPTGMIFVEAELAPSDIPHATPHSPAWVLRKST